MSRLRIGWSLRARLLAATLLVQAVMLALLLANGVRTFDETLSERARLYLESQQPLLNAALAPLLGRGDTVAIQRLLDDVRRQEDGAYLVVADPAGRVLAASGPRPTEEELPSGDRFNADMAIVGAGGTLGTLRYGWSRAFVAEARSHLVRESLAIGVLFLLATLGATLALSYWLTRHLRELSAASERLAAGDLDVRLPETGDHDLGRLTRAFNAMAAALEGRIRALADSEAKFNAIADYSYDVELWIGPDGRLIWINPRVTDMFGYTPEECLATDDFPAPFISEPDVGRTMRQIRRALRGNSGQDYEFRVRRKNGEEFWAAADWRPIYDARGGYLGIRISIRDVTQSKLAEQRLEATVLELREAQAVQQEYVTRAQNEHARLTALLAAMDIGILFVAPDRKVVYSNPAFTRIWALPPGARLIGRDPQEVLESSACALARPDEQRRHLLRAPRAGEILGTLELELADGRLITQQGHAVEDVYGRAVGHLWLFEDVTRERQTADQLVYLAERDALTGLYNRHRFNEELMRMIADAQRHTSRLALLFFDLDDFKYINDTFGHRAGDAMLIRVAGEVAGQVRRNEIFSRLGGDEFAILVPDADDEMLRVLAERITRSISLVRFQFEGESLRLTSSLGIAVFPDHAESAEELIARADTAMYQAKEAGKNAWRIYRSDLDTSQQMVSRLSWNDRILHALEAGYMHLQFQGVYAAQDRSLTHFEALVRMRDKDNPDRLLMPGDFIPMAEKSGRILDIDRWVVREAIEMLGNNEAIPAIAVNISGRSFDEPTLPRYIAAELQRCRVAPRRLLVELTETSAVSDLHDAQRFIEALRDTGCGVCLDDFGTGFSSFAYLKHLQADSVKIDGLFIRNLPHDRDNQLFVKAIVAVARGLHKTTIAECVEDEETLAMLKSFDVDCAQGYYLERPRDDHPLIVAARRARAA